MQDGADGFNPTPAGVTFMRVEAMLRPTTVKGKLGVEDLIPHLEATGRCFLTEACLVSESLLESSPPVSQKIIVLSQKQTQFSVKEVSGEVFQILLVDWDTEFYNILPEHTGTSLGAVPPQMNP